MATAGSQPQDKQEEELFLTGEMQHFSALMHREARLARSLTFQRPKRVILRLLGPVQDGESTCWLVPTSMHADLVLGYPQSPRTGWRVIGWAGLSISISPSMTLQQIYDLAIANGIDICLALHLGLLHAGPLPGGRLRLLFAVAGCDVPSVFWLWVDGLTAELHRLGFCPSPSLDAPSPPAGEPEPFEPIQSGWLAGQASGGDQPAARRPWLQIPDLGWDRLALEYWWRGYTILEIAARLELSPKTISNRLTNLRRTHGTDVVPTDRLLRTQNIK